MGSGAEATIIVGNDSKVESINISKGGSGYTYGTVDLVAGEVPTDQSVQHLMLLFPTRWSWCRYLQGTWC